MRDLALFLTCLACLGNSNLTNADQQPLLQGNLMFKAQALSIDVEIAATAEQRQTGLMYRQSLAPGHGMLFVFNDEAMRGVWMKNTLIPLDVLFLNHNGHIVSMLENLPPCRQSNCPTYSSAVPASFMLEVSAGFITEHELQINQPVELPF